MMHFQKKKKEKEKGGATKKDTVPKQNRKPKNPTRPQISKRNRATTENSVRKQGQLWTTILKYQSCGCSRTPRLLFLSLPTISHVTSSISRTFSFRSPIESRHVCNSGDKTHVTYACSSFQRSSTTEPVRKLSNS
jgi:hypothetical protein